MELPQLPYDFNGAIIEDIVVGPRREVTLLIVPCVWTGHQGKSLPSMTVRFGGIVNFEEVSAFFALSRHNHTDLAWLRYDKSQQSKPNDLFFELMYERIEARIVVHCRNISIISAEPPVA